MQRLLVIIKLLNKTTCILHNIILYNLILLLYDFVN